MQKTIFQVAGAKKLSTHAQKKIFGGLWLPPADCSCFCFTSTGTKVSTYCYACCPNGTYPGVDYGSPSGVCGFNGNCGDNLH